MIKVPFTTLRILSGSESSQVIFHYQGVRHQLLGTICTWQGTSEDLAEIRRERNEPRESLHFNIHRLIGPRVAIDAFLEAYGDVTTWQNAPDLLFARTACTIILENPTLIGFANRMYVEDMGSIEQVYGMYIEGRISRRAGEQ
jgi:hypothetical protein